VLLLDDDVAHEGLEHLSRHAHVTLLTPSQFLHQCS
jgi:hypothetical protein